MFQPISFIILCSPLSGKSCEGNQRNKHTGEVITSVRSETGFPLAASSVVYGEKISWRIPAMVFLLCPIYSSYTILSLCYQHRGRRNMVMIFSLLWFDWWEKHRLSQIYARVYVLKRTWVVFVCVKLTTTVLRVVTCVIWVDTVFYMAARVTWVVVGVIW